MQYDSVIKLSNLSNNHVRDLIIIEDDDDDIPSNTHQQQSMSEKQEKSTSHQSKNPQQKWSSEQFLQQMDIETSITKDQNLNEQYNNEIKYELQKVQQQRQLKQQGTNGNIQDKNAIIIDDINDETSNKKQFQNQLETLELSPSPTKDTQHVNSILNESDEKQADLNAILYEDSNTLKQILSKNKAKLNMSTNKSNNKQKSKKKQNQEARKNIIILDEKEEENVYVDKQFTNFSNTLDFVIDAQTAVQSSQSSPQKKKYKQLSSVNYTVLGWNRVLKSDQASINALIQNQQNMQQNQGQNQLQHQEQTLGHQQQQLQQTQEELQQREDDLQNLKTDFEYQPRYFMANPTQLCRRCKRPGHIEKSCLEEDVQTQPCLFCLSFCHLKYQCDQFLCFSCNQIGHMTRDCINKTKKQQHCNRCELKGHDKQSCQVLMLSHPDLNRPRFIFSKNSKPESNNNNKRNQNNTAAINESEAKQLRCLKCLQFGHSNCGTVDYKVPKKRITDLIYEVEFQIEAQIAAQKEMTNENYLKIGKKNNSCSFIMEKDEQSQATEEELKLKVKSKSFQSSFQPLLEDGEIVASNKQSQRRDQDQNYKQNSHYKNKHGSSRKRSRSRSGSNKNRKSNNHINNYNNNFNANSNKDDKRQHFTSRWEYKQKQFKIQNISRFGSKKHNIN